MAWGLWINSVDRTSLVSQPDGVDLEFTLNERATARFTLLSSLVPTRLSEIQVVDQGGSTRIFGGLILQRRTKPRPGKHDHYRTECECSDFGAYTDWCFQTKTYTSSVTLAGVLTDLVTDKLGTYGITLASSQVAGPALAPFAWNTYRVSDGLRELSDRTGYAWTINADKVLEMFVPGTTPAPASISDGSKNALEAHWADPTQIGANQVLLWCGPPGGLAWSNTIAWYGSMAVNSGTIKTFNTDYPASASFSERWPNQVWNSGAGPYGPCWWGAPSSPTPGVWYWDYPNHRLLLNDTTSAVAAGDVLTILGYTIQYPFLVTALGSTSPVIEYLATDETITDKAAGQEVANGILAQLQGASQELEITTLTTGWAIGQELPVVLTARDLNDVYVVTDVRVRAKTDTRWLYTLNAIPSSVYGGGYLARWREMRGEGSSSGVMVLPGTTSGLPGPSYLGGSRFHAVQVSA